MTIYIKNMVCVRCKMAVQSVLHKLKINFISIELGWVQLAEEIDAKQLEAVDKELQYYHLEIMNNPTSILVEKIKTTIIKMLHADPNHINIKLSAYLTKQLGFDYTYLSNTFSEQEGYTIERFFIENRVDRVKELLVYEDLTVTEIFHRMNYSSVAHLCSQFKKVTGKTPSEFKKLCRTENFIWKTYN